MEEEEDDDPFLWHWAAEEFSLAGVTIMDGSPPRHSEVRAGIGNLARVLAIAHLHSLRRTPWDL